MGARRTIAVGLAALVATAGAAAPSAGAQATPEKPPRLKPVDSCSALMRFARRHTSAYIVPAESRENRGKDFYRDPLGGTPVAEPGAGGGEARGRDQAGGDQSEDFSRTNVQEEGIDEPDPVKTDGRYLFSPGGDNHQLLVATDARAETPHVVGSVKLPGDHGGGAQLLLSGDRILALTYGDSEDDPYESATILSEIDISNPAAMRVLRTEKVEGDFLDARLHGNVARVALWTAPREIVVEQPAGVEWSAAGRWPRHRSTRGVPAKSSRTAPRACGRSAPRCAATRCGARASTRASACSPSSRSTWRAACRRSTRTR
jgi:hypothetical protein